MTSATRAQRLIDEFQNAACACHSAHKARFGIAAVLWHIVDTEIQDDNTIPVRTLEDLANALEAPTLNDIALQMLDTIERDAHYLPEITDTIRRALEPIDA